MRDFVEQLLSAQTVDDVWSCHTERMSAYGFDRMIYGRSFGTEASSDVNLEDTFFLSNLPDDYQVRFEADSLYAHSPMAAWSDPKPGIHIHVWDGYRAYAPGAQARDAASLNRHFGVAQGYTITFGATPPSGSAGIVLIARKGLDQDATQEIWDRHGDTIVLMNQLVHLRLSGLPRPDNGRTLTQRQREVLRLVARGYSTAEIATRLELSRVTVEKHLALARQQLGAATTVQAVLKAAIEYYILLDDN
ncbi:MAG: LuxR family transcriptional regulator [Pseudomonadota bacterium]